MNPRRLFVQRQLDSAQSMSLVQSEVSASAPAVDLALVKQLLEGDEAAFTGGVERYHGPLLRFARLFVSNRAVAEEVVQDTWLAAIESPPERFLNVGGWLHRVTGHSASRMKRRRAQRISRGVPGMRRV